jgi:hypothetical protein
MSVDHPTKTWSTQDIDRMLELLGPIFAPGFELATWVYPDPIEKDGKLVHVLGWPDYHPIVHEFIQFCCDSSTFIDPYALLPEDPPVRGEGEPVTPRILTSPEDMRMATLNQIRRYFVILTRGEYWCEGYIAQQFEDGLLQAAVRRVRVLREAMEEST